GLLLPRLETLGQHVFIHVAERRDFSLRNLCEFLHVVPTAPTDAANSHADAVVRAKNSLRMSNESDPAERGQTRAGLQKVPAVDFRFLGHNHPLLRFSAISRPTNHKPVRERSAPCFPAGG